MRRGNPLIYSAVRRCGDLVARGLGAASGDARDPAGSRILGLASVSITADRECRQQGRAYAASILRTLMAGYGLPFAITKPRSTRAAKIVQRKPRALRATPYAVSGRRVALF
jgi:hypothetical protein